MSPRGTVGSAVRLQLRAEPARGGLEEAFEEALQALQDAHGRDASTRSGRLSVSLQAPSQRPGAEDLRLAARTICLTDGTNAVFGPFGTPRYTCAPTGRHPGDARPYA